ncbi:class I SAM-dependent methyltransferase [Endozoicomonadaceae bacterium StTr2]
MYPCPLCDTCVDNTPWHQDKFRIYLRCSNCFLVFVPPEYHLSAEAEKAIYDRHDNQVNEPGYRRFLSRMYDPICERVKVGAEGLDFGCGPGPALAAMFEEAGYKITLYDLYYANNPERLTRTYDFITATEVMEHLSAPGRVLENLISLLRPGGTLGIMTKLVKSREAFRNWHYIRDPTHICFFSHPTIEWISRKYFLHAEIIGPDIILLRARRDVEATA